ncbi:MAG TPA: ribosome-binding factor A [Egicoccus sp.]|nr:ribosome-binding factor A [Egicoccus sp.]HSK22657.1 ribosome-binding factor A [Egicoccus sp.]
MPLTAAIKETAMVKKRNPRVDRAVRQAVADLLETEIADPRLQLITITEAEVTQDHEVATIYYSTLDPSLVSGDPRRTGGDRLPEPHEVEAGFAAAAPRLRGLVGRRAKLRTSPELRFKPDPVVEQANRVEHLLRRLGEDAPSDADGDATGDGGDAR